MADLTTNGAGGEGGAVTPAPAPPAGVPPIPAEAPSTIDAPLSVNGSSKKSFGSLMESTLTDMGQEFGLDEMGRLTIQSLSKEGPVGDTVDGHSVEDLEKIAAGGGEISSPAPPLQPLSTTQPSSDVASLQQQVNQLTQLMGLLAQEKLAAIQGQNGQGNGHTPAPTPSMRDALAKQLEDAGYDEGMADIFMGAMDQREKQLRSQIESQYNLPQLQLQGDLVRLYNQFGEDFKSSLPAIEKIRQGDPNIPLEQAYLGVKTIKEALGMSVPNNSTQAGGNPSQPTAQKPVLTTEEARALLAKRDLMRTESGVNGTEARPPNVKKSFGEMLHEGISTARKQGRVGG